MLSKKPPVKKTPAKSATGKTAPASSIKPGSDKTPPHKGNPSTSDRLPLTGGKRKNYGGKGIARPKAGKVPSPKKPSEVKLPPAIMNLPIGAHKIYQQAVAADGMTAGWTAVKKVYEKNAQGRWVKKG